MTPNFAIPFFLIFSLLLGLWINIFVLTTLQQNGVVEHKYRQILDVAWAHRFQSGLSKYHWGDCLLTAAQLIDRIPTPILNNKTLFELLHYFNPKYDHCHCFASIRYLESDKFFPCTR